MEIVIVYTYDPSKLQEGGGIRYTHNLIDGILEKNIDVTLLGVQLAIKQTYEHPHFTFVPILHKSETWWRYFFNLFFKAQFISFSDSALIHTQRTYFMLPFILFHRKNSKICTLHMKPLEFVKVQYPRYFKYVDKIHKIVEGFCINRIDMLIAINDEVKQAYVKRYPRIMDKIKVIYGTGVDINKFKLLDKNKMREKYGLKPEDVIILFAGRIEKIKNLDFLVNSFKIFTNQISKSKLVIIGRGSETKHFEALVKKLELEKEVIFMGEVNPKNMPEIYNCADVFALSSYSESSPTVVREALACGIPIVTTNVGDVKEIIVNSFLGIIIDTYDEKLFAKVLFDTIEMVKANPDEVRNKCRRVALKHFNSAEIVADNIKIYRSIAQGDE